MDHPTRNIADAQARAVPPTVQAPAPRPQTTLCPYCGHVSAIAKACERCRGVFEPLSRQASQNAMGPWFVRDESNPFLPGFSLSTLRQMVRRGRITPDTIIKGPSTRQFWAYARSVPGVAHLLGACHVCRAPANADLASCTACGTSFVVPDDREHLGLTPVRLLPGQADPAQIAANGATGAPTPTPSNSSPPMPVARVNGSEIDAAAMISARQRQRRAQRRRTIGLIVLVVVLVGLGAAVAAVFSNSSASSGGGLRNPEPPKAPGDAAAAKPAGPSPSTERGEPANPVEPAAEPPLAAAGPEVREPATDDLLGRLVTASLDDLAQVIEAAQAAAGGGPGVDPRLAGAISAARQRLSVGRAGQRL